MNFKQKERIFSKITYPQTDDADESFCGGSLVVYQVDSVQCATRQSCQTFKIRMYRPDLRREFATH